MSMPISKLSASRVLVEQARELLGEDCEVHERLRTVLDLSIDALEQAERFAGLDRQAKIVPLFSVLNRET